MTLTASPARRPSAADARTGDVPTADGSGDTAVRALERVTVERPAGRYIAVVGPSGSAGRGRHHRQSRRAIGPGTAPGVA